MGGRTFTHAARRSPTSTRANMAASVSALSVVRTITGEWSAAEVTIALVLRSGFWYLYSRSKRAILPRTTIEKTGARHHDDLLAAATAAPPRGPLSGCRGR